MDPGTPADGSRDMVITTVYLSIVNYQCDIGYNMNGAPQIQCMANGQWSSSAPTCQSQYLIHENLTPTSTVFTYINHFCNNSQ